MNAVLEAREPNARYFAALKPALLSQFDLIAQAPNGVARLRELILTLAVQGKLVPQDPNDEPASALLERIRAEKARLVKEGKIRKDKPQAAIAEEEKPFAIPPRWEWARIGDVLLQVTDGTHHTPKYLDSGVAFISVKDIDGKSISFADCKYISEAEHLQINARCNPERGDVLLCRIGTLGRPTIVDTDRPFSLFVSVGLLKLPKSVDISKYLHLLLSSQVMAAQYDEIKAGGSHTNKLNLGDIPQLRVPTPPLAEQTRIVARVEELMALCDSLEVKGKLGAEQHTRLVGSLFDSLANSESAHALAENWQRIATHFDLLLDRPAAVDTLEQSILQLAVRGLLVPQNPADEPASALLQKIRTEKDRLIATGQLKRDRPQPSISNEEKPFEPPKGWEWVALKDLLPEFQNGVSSRGDVGGKSITVLRLADIKNRRISLRDTREIPINERDAKKYGLLKGDILIVRVNGSADIVGQFILNDDDLTAIYCDHFIRMRIDQTFITPDFLSLLGESDIARSRIQSLFITTAGQKTVNQSHIGSLLLPLPPLPEQSRIVARVAELRTLCTQLRERLAATDQIQSRLAATLIEKVVA